MKNLRGMEFDTLQVHEDIYLTDLAREKAERLGITLVTEHLTPASAPIRPYIGAQPRSQAAARAA